MINTILCCSDGSEPALQAARCAADIALRFDAEMLVLSVFPDPATLTSAYGAWALTVDPEMLAAASTQDHEAIESATTPIFERLGVRCRTVRETGHPAEEIVRVAEREKVDLIVLGSRGLNGWKSLLLGSVADGVLHHAHCPVLIAR